VAGYGLYIGTAALSERDYVARGHRSRRPHHHHRHDTIEKPPFIMGPHGPQVIHVGYQPANVEQIYFPQTEVIGDMGPSLRLLQTGSRAGSRMPAHCCLCAKASSAVLALAQPKTASRRNGWCTTSGTSFPRTASSRSTRHV